VDHQSVTICNVSSPSTFLLPIIRRVFFFEGDYLNCDIFFYLGHVDAHYRTQMMARFLLSMTNTASQYLLLWCNISDYQIIVKYTVPFGLAAEYAYPAQVLILGTGTISGSIFCTTFVHDLRTFTVYIWITLRLFQAVDAQML